MTYDEYRTVIDAVEDQLNIDEKTSFTIDFFVEENGKRTEAQIDGRRLDVITASTGKAMLLICADPGMEPTPSFAIPLDDVTKVVCDDLDEED